MTQLNLIDFKNVFLYEIGLIAVREVSPPFDEEQQYYRPYQPKHSPSLHKHVDYRPMLCMCQCISANLSVKGKRIKGAPKERKRTEA